MTPPRSLSILRFRPTAGTGLSLDPPILQHLDDVERFLPQCRWKERFESIPRYPVPGEEGPNFYHPEGPHPLPDSALGVEWRRVMRRWRRGQVVGWIRFKATWWQRFWARLRRPK